MAANVAAHEINVHISGQEPDGHDAHGVGEYCDGNGQQAQAGFRGEGSQEEVAHQKASDEQSPGRVYGARFFGDHDPNAGQLKREAVPEKRRACKPK